MNRNLNMVNNSNMMMVDPRRFNPNNLIQQLRSVTGGTRGVKWAMEDSDVLWVIQSKAIMVFSAYFPQYKDIPIYTSKTNRVIEDKKGIYFHNLPDDEILLGVEHVYASFKQAQSFHQLPTGGGIGRGGIMTSAQNGLSEVYRQSATTIGSAYPENSTTSYGIKFSPHSWINESEGAGFTIIAKLAHSLDFSTMDQYDAAKFLEFAKIVFCKHIAEEILPGVKDISTEIGQYATDYVSTIERYADRYESYIELMSKERMFAPRRKKIRRG